MLKKIVIGADHLGKNLKDEIKEHLESKGIEVMDVGVTDDSQVDYPDVGKTLAKKVQDSEFERGILVCGTGAGMAIVANKFSGEGGLCKRCLHSREIYCEQKCSNYYLWCFNHRYSKCNYVYRYLVEK